MESGFLTKRNLVEKRLGRMAISSNTPIDEIALTGLDPKIGLNSGLRRTLYMLYYLICQANADYDSIKKRRGLGVTGRFS